MSQDRHQRRLADFAGTVLFLLLNAFVWRASLFLLGRPQTASTGYDVARYGGLVLLALSLAVSVWQLARARSAAVLAIIGCVLQIVLGAILWAMR